MSASTPERSPKSLLVTALVSATAGLVLALGLRLASPEFAECGSALPREAWQRHDIRLLSGEWRRFSNMRTRRVDTGVELGVRSWTFRFDDAGAGSQSMTWTDGASCNGHVRAHFDEGGTLVLDAEACTGPETLVATNFRCRRIDARVADCLSLETDPALRGNRTWAQAHGGLFQR